MSEGFEAVWERYVSSWKAETEAEQRALFEGCLDPACVYTDPSCSGDTSFSDFWPHRARLSQATC